MRLSSEPARPEISGTCRRAWHDLAGDLREHFDVVEDVVEVAGTAYPLLHPRSSEDLLDEEEFDRDGRIPYWADIWSSSLVLAERIAACRGEGRRYLELGCGVGLPSLVAAMAGFQVIATDYYAEALEFARVNAVRVGAELDTRLLDWRRLPADLGWFDLIAAADVLYEKPHPALVASAIDACLDPSGLAIIGDPGRHHARALAGECRSRGLAIQLSEQVAIARRGARQTIDVYRITRAGSAGVGR